MGKGIFNAARWALLRRPPRRRARKIWSSASDRVPFNPRTNRTVYCISGSACHDPGRGESRLRASGARLPRLLAPTGSLGGPPLSEWSPALLTLALDRPSHARSFSPHRPWSSLFGLCGIMQAKSDLPGGERKEGMMIRELAQIVFRQVCAPSRRILDEPDPPPARCPIIGQTPCASAASPCAEAKIWGTAASDAGRGPEELSQALVILFTQLAQRRVQAARAQEDVHEYGSHHHSPPRAVGLRLRQAIHPVAGK